MKDWLKEGEWEKEVDFLDGLKGFGCKIENADFSYTIEFVDNEGQRWVAYPLWNPEKTKFCIGSFNKIYI